MLKVLGTIFYIFAVIALIFALPRANDYCGGVAVALGAAAAISAAFYGAMCFVVDDIRALLKRIADGVAPEAELEPEPNAIPCEWCKRRVAEPYRPCSAIDPEKLIEVAGHIKAQRCQDELRERGFTTA